MVTSSYAYSYIMTTSTCGQISIYIYTHTHTYRQIYIIRNMSIVIWFADATEANINTETYTCFNRRQIELSLQKLFRCLLTFNHTIHYTFRGQYRQEFFLHEVNRLIQHFSHSINNYTPWFTSQHIYSLQSQYKRALGI